MPATRRRRAGRSVSPLGVNISCGVSTDTVSPTRTPSFVARSLPRRMPSRLSSDARSSASMLPLSIALLMSVTCCSSSGSIPLTIDRLRIARRRDEPLAQNRRRRTDDAGKLAQLVGLRAVIVDALRVPDVDVGIAADDAVAKLVLKARSSGPAR